MAFGLLMPFAQLPYKLLVVRSGLFQLVGHLQQGAFARASVLDVRFHVLDVGFDVLIIAIPAFLAGALSKRFVSGIIAGVLLAFTSIAVGLFTLGLHWQDLTGQYQLQIVKDSSTQLLILVSLGISVGAACGALGARIRQAAAQRP
jgi:hypothetical protein